MLSRDQIMRESATAGFQAEPLEKAAYLLELLDSLYSHPFLKGRCPECFSTDTEEVIDQRDDRY